MLLFRTLHNPFTSTSMPKGRTICEFHKSYGLLFFYRISPSKESLISIYHYTTRIYLTTITLLIPILLLNNNSFLNT